MTTSRVISRIEELIPQRSPIQMVDELLWVEGDRCFCRLAVRSGNFFLEKDGRLAEVGVLEHIAQSASAFAGYRAVCAGATKPPIGYIGEVKNFCVYRRPQQGEVLVSIIEMGASVGGVTIVHGTTQAADGDLVAETQIKIFIR